VVRTQVQFTDEQIQGLRALSAQTGRSIADLTRDAVTDLLRRRGGSTEALINGARSVVGAFSSGSPDGSTAHDRHLADAFL
jgi:hypothetical protein